MADQEQSRDIIARLCPHKKKGHRCVIDRNTKHTPHQCHCGEQWEEVAT